MEKLTQQIAGAYTGAQVEISGIVTYGISHISANGIMVDTGERFKYTPYDQCRLILTPLSAISDEDAVEVARMVNALDIVSNLEYMTKVGKAYIKRNITTFPFFIIDYLRSRNYDLGYMGVRSLIDADIAISSLDKTETHVQP